MQKLRSKSSQRKKDPHKYHINSQENKGKEHKKETWKNLLT